MTRTPMRPDPRRDLAACLLTALLGFAVLLGGCGDAWSGHDDPFITGIREVRVEPNPVVAGDTALFTCVISDSQTPGFRYLVYRKPLISTLSNCEIMIGEYEHYGQVARSFLDVYPENRDMQKRKCGHSR